MITTKPITAAKKNPMLKPGTPVTFGKLLPIPNPVVKTVKASPGNMVNKLTKELNVLAAIISGLKILP